MFVRFLSDTDPVPAKKKPTKPAAAPTPAPAPKAEPPVAKAEAPKAATPKVAAPKAKKPAEPKPAPAAASLPPAVVPAAPTPRPVTDDDIARVARAIARADYRSTVPAHEIDDATHVPMDGFYAGLARAAIAAVRDLPA